MSWPGPDDAYLALVDTAMAERAAETRERRHEQDRRTAEVASWSGLLVQVAELAQPVGLAVAGGRRWHGVVEAVGRDHVVLRVGPETLVCVFRERLRWLQVLGGPLPSGSDPRLWTDDRTLFEHLDRAIRPGDALVVHLRDVGVPLAGRLVSLGDDLLAIGLQGDPGQRRVVPAAAISEVVIPDVRLGAPDPGPAGH